MKKVLNYLDGEKQRILEQHYSVRISANNIDNLIKEQEISGKGNDPYDYKKDGSSYFTKKKGTSNWIKLTPDTRAYNAVRNLFGQNTDVSQNTTQKNTSTSNVSNKDFYKQVLALNKSDDQVYQDKINPSKQKLDKDFINKSYNKILGQYITDYKKDEKLNWLSSVPEQVRNQVLYLKSIQLNEPFTILDDRFDVLYLINKDYTLNNKFKVNTGLNIGDAFDNDTAISWCSKNLGELGKLNFEKDEEGMYKVVKNCEDAFYKAKQGYVRNTPTGIFRRAGFIYDWLNNKVQTALAASAVGERLISFVALDGTILAHGLHGTKDPSRLNLLNYSDFKKAGRNITFGCINLLDSDLKKVNQFMSNGQYSFWLSDVNTSDILKFPNDKKPSMFNEFLYQVGGMSGMESTFPSKTQTAKKVG